MAYPAHHFSIHRQLSRRRATRAVDTLAYVVGVGGNLAVIPQVIRAWQSDAPGLAVLTWLLFMAIGLLWLAYACLHRQKPLIAAQTAGILCNFAIVLGWMVNTMRH